MSKPCDVHCRQLTIGGEIKSAFLDGVIGLEGLVPPVHQHPIRLGLGGGGRALGGERERMMGGRAGQVLAIGRG